MRSPALRRSLFDRTWSLVSAARAARPQNFSGTAGASAGVPCPFCEGSEVETEKEVFAVRRDGSPPDGPGWTLRVVPNRFPALTPDAKRETGSDDCLYEQLAAFGYHEVVVEAPDHDWSPACGSLEELQTVLAVYRERLAILSDRPGVRSLVVLRNEGRAAGASQPHPHSQILALPLIPARLRDELAAANRYVDEHGRCITCDLLEREEGEGRRVIAANPDFVALACFAPRFAYETWIVPRLHHHDFRAVQPVETRSLASILRQVLGALARTHPGCPYNLVLHTAPIGGADAARCFHWRVEILPRLSIPSGLELGCDVFIVSVPPEQAAERLRAALT